MLVQCYVPEHVEGRGGTLAVQQEVGTVGLLQGLVEVDQNALEGEDLQF